MVYPYLLRGIAITRPNQVCSTDVTYIRMDKGFSYLVAIMDWYSRKVLSWRISNSMDVFFLRGLSGRGSAKAPEIFNSDQGSQFTSESYTGVLTREDITINQYGRQGRVLDNIFVQRLWRNVKHEDIYLKYHVTVGKPTAGLGEYFLYYNGERPHQSLKYKTPDAVYASGSGGGAIIIEKYKKAASKETHGPKDTVPGTESSVVTNPDPVQMDGMGEGTA